jgi:hypothetical protein
MWDRPPLGAMTTGELDGCLERVGWLIDRKQLMPHDVFFRLETWFVDMRAEVEDRAAREAASRQRAQT